MIQLLLVSFTRLAAAKISCLLTSSTSPSQQPRQCRQCAASRCHGGGLDSDDDSLRLGLPSQVGASRMSCRIFKQSCQSSEILQERETKCCAPERWSRCSYFTLGPTRLFDNVRVVQQQQFQQGDRGRSYESQIVSEAVEA